MIFKNLSSRICLKVDSVYPGDTCKNVVDILLSCNNSNNHNFLNETCVYAYYRYWTLNCKYIALSLKWVKLHTREGLTQIISFLLHFHITNVPKWSTPHPQTIPSNSFKLVVKIGKICIVLGTCPSDPTAASTRDLGHDVGSRPGVPRGGVVEPGEVVLHHLAPRACLHDQQAQQVAHKLQRTLEIISVFSVFTSEIILIPSQIYTLYTARVVRTFRQKQYCWH